MTAIQKAREALADVRSYISCQRPQAAFSRRAQSEELAMIDAALAALDAETPVTPADVGERDIYEVANQLLGYVGPDTPEPLAKFLLREGEAASELADTIVRLRARLETVEADTRERIAAALDEEADLIPCAEDAMMTRSNARLIRADFSYEDADRLASEEDASQPGATP